MLTAVHARPFTARVVAKPARVARVATAVRCSVKPVQAVSKIMNASAVRPALVTLVANVLMALPASAEGKLFDFNLTLPVMATEFLLLMVFLDKFWFSPVGKVLDERDEVIRSKLGEVKDNASDITRLQDEAEKLISAARAEVMAKVNEAKASAQADCDAKLAVYKAKIEAELNDAIAALDKERETLLSSVDAQVAQLEAEILKRVLPAGMKL
jgi:F-type H+-transporting ATPase subunit b